MNKPVDHALIDFNDEDSNRSANPHFAQVLDARLSRRSLLRGGFGGATTAVLGTSLLAACGSDDPVAPPPAPAPLPAPAPSPIVTRLGFGAVGKSLADVVTVPAGYTATILYALGDPLRAATPAYKNDGTDADFENRAGDHHDGMEWFGLSSTGTPSLTAADRGLLAMNHEATTDETRASFFIHPTGGTATLPRPVDETDKEMALHGISVVEIKKTGSAWAYVADSAFNFRIVPTTEIDIGGPLRGNALAITKYSPTGTVTRGTINNCGTGKTPWGSFVTGEENWSGYFFRVATDNTVRGNDKSVTSLNRYGRAQGAASRHGWETASADDRHVRFNISRSGVSVDGSDDYRHEMNLQGYIVEIDPYTKAKKAVKRSALGRFAHESAAFGTPVVGQPIAAYMGDDSRNEYIYKFVSTAVWSAADATPTDRLATGAKYLDQGKLFVAKFNADGSGQWVELSMTNPAVRDYTGYTFADQADICVNARLAGDAVGATKMDRPEWCSVNPKNGEVYFALTNNSNRRVDPSGSSQLAPDSANPRAYSDIRGGSSTNSGNPNGHILRLKEGSGGSSATAFTWDIYVFAAETSAATGTVNLSNLTGDQDMSSPDGLAFSPTTGICWIQTDDGAYTDVTNCMMLAAIPGQVGDGAKRTLSYARSGGGTLTVDTYVGAAPTADNLKRFLVGPKDCEITGIADTPDGKALFVNIQHPGEGTRMADVTDPTKYTSQWPSNAGYGAGKRPRSATIVITKNDGGVIGS